MIYPITSHEIAAMRAYRGWTQGQLAERVGVAGWQSVARWESGAVIPNPAARKRLWNLANAVRLECDEPELPLND